MLRQFAGFSVHARVRGPASQIQEIGHVKSLWNVAIAVCVGAVAGFVAGVQMHSNGAVGAPLRAENRPAQQPSALPPGSETVYKVILGDPPMKGDEEAKVTIIEFSDFQCPYCGRAIDLLKQVESKYGKDVRFAFKNNPLPMHPDAPYAARAALAAGKQGKFWQMHDKLFEANNSRQPDALKAAKIDRMASEIGLDLERFHKDIDAPEMKDLIESD